MHLTIEVPDSLKPRIQQIQASLPEMLERVVTEMLAESSREFQQEEEVLEFLADNPTPEQILSLRPSAGLQARVSELLEKRKAGSLSSRENIELERYLMLEHLVRLAKARARERLARIR
jgi:hypothetical protein